MSAWQPTGEDTGPKGKMHQKGSVKRIGQAKQHAHLPARMKADDSRAVCMSDQVLGKGIRT